MHRFQPGAASSSVERSIDSPSQPASPSAGAAMSLAEEQLQEALYKQQLALCHQAISQTQREQQALLQAINAAKHLPKHQRAARLAELKSSYNEKQDELDTYQTSLTILERPSNGGVAAMSAAAAAT